MKTENLSTLKIHKLTKAQYDRELAAGNIDENALYLTPDEEIDLSPYATKDEMNDKAGMIVTGQSFTLADGTTVTAGNYAEVFNTYPDDELFANKATGNRSHAEGCKTEATGDTSHAEGYNTTASGDYSHVEGWTTEASGMCTHAEGRNATASEDYAHAEGYDTTASNTACHAEGYNTTASGIYSHAEGDSTTASGSVSHAEGYGTIASGLYSHVEGRGTEASGDCSHVEGKFNIIDSSDAYLHIAGNGESYAARSNAHTLDWDGNAWFAGEVYVGGDGQSNGKQLATKEYVDSLFASIAEIKSYLGI